MIIFLIYILFLFTGCSNDKEGELKSKVISELDYMDITIVEMLNKLNNISFEKYSIISQKVELDDEGQQSQDGEKSGESSESGGKSSSGESGGEEEKGQEGKKENSINATTMASEVELSKDRNNVDWNTIKSEIETLNESWTVTILDLYTLNVKNDFILDFSDKLNASMLAIKNEDKKQSLTALADLYSSIPEFLREIDADKNKQKIRQTQSYVINAYILADDIENTKISENITQAITTYSEVMSDIDYTKDKTQKTNKVYILLNEVSNSLTEKDADIFYIKYKNFMKEIEAI